MRFKVVYDEKSDKIDVNCIPDNGSEIIIPEDMTQHVHFPAPRELIKHIQREMSSLVSDADTEEYQSILVEIKELQNKRKELINNLREQINPKIIEKCEELRVEYAEYYI